MIDVTENANLFYVSSFDESGKVQQEWVVGT